MKKIIALLLAVAMLFCFAGCGTKDTNSGTEAKSDLKVGLICLHGDSSTYDKNFIDAFKEACANKGLTEDNYTIVTDIDEGTACYDQAADLAETCDLIFADSFGHEPYMIQAAKEFPEVEFCHATGVKAHTEGLANYHNAFASIYEGRFLAGVAAGMKLVELYGDEEGKVSNENAKIGYVGAFPYAEVISGYTSFYLGVKHVVENATMEVRYTNSWYDEAAEKTTALALIDNGCKLISQHADSWGAPTACEERNIPNVSYNGSTAEKCPKTFIVASRINWTPYFEYIIDCVKKGEKIDTDWTGTLETGSVEITEVGAAAAEGTQAKLDEVKAKLIDGSLKVFDCATFTVDNKALTSYEADVDDAGDFVPETEVIETIGDITFVNESAKRSAPYFNIIIDGITAVTE